LVENDTFKPIHHEKAKRRKSNQGSGRVVIWWGKRQAGIQHDSIILVQTWH
jgi:hypothetical protein